MYCIVYLKFAKKVALECSYHTHNKIDEEIDVLTSLPSVITLPCVCMCVFIYIFILWGTP
jgi:hypothetical protein